MEDPFQTGSLSVAGLFQTPLAAVTLAGHAALNAELTQRILDRRPIEPGVAASNVGGWHSAEFQSWSGPAGARLLDAARQLVDRLTVTEGPDGLTRAQINWRVTAWANISGAGDANRAHGHPGAFWSGVYWVDDGGADADESVGGLFEMIDPRGLLPVMYAPDLRYAVADALGQAAVAVGMGVDQARNDQAVGGVDGARRLGIAPTIPLHCSDDFMRGCRDLAMEFGLPVQTHLAEAPIQREGAQRRYGTTLTAHLERIGLLGPRFSGAHAVWIDDSEIELIARHGGALAHNPGSNLRLGNGIADMRRAIAGGVTVGVGTDGSSSSDNQNMFEAMRLAAFVSRVFRPCAGRVDRQHRSPASCHSGQCGGAGNGQPDRPHRAQI